jgi:hypothetical protein
MEKKRSSASTPMLLIMKFRMPHFMPIAIMRSGHLQPATGFAYLATETIKKGSPYTLRIVKTQAAYQRQLKQWNEDAALLKKVMLKIEALTGQ